MMADLLRLTVAMVLFAAVAIAPGWAGAYWFDLLNFRKRFFTMRLAVALCASLAFVPAVFMLLGRYAGLSACTALTVFCLVAALAAVLHDARRRNRVSRGERLGIARRATMKVVALIAIAWLVVAIASLLDIQIGDRLFISVTWIDHGKRIAVIDSIARTGIPPISPFAHPGHAVINPSYYGWYAWAAVIEQIGGGFIRPLHVLIAGVVWSGWALIASLAIALHAFTDVSLRQLRSRWLVAALLLCVTGLDIIPGLMNLARYVFLKSGQPPRTIEWWNEQVNGLIDMMLWVPHHVAALVAGIFAFALFRAGGKFGAVTVVAIALSISSMTNQSLFITMPIAIFLPIYVVICLIKQRRAEALRWIACGILAALITLPFVIDLMSATQLRGGIVFRVRKFPPADYALRLLHLDTENRAAIARIVLLPLNYFLEFGFFCVAAFFTWRWQRRAGKHFDGMACGILLASLGVATFLRSDLAFNDLGWRSMVWAQIVLLLWSIEPAIAIWHAGIAKLPPMSEYFAKHQQWARALRVMLILGASATLYNLILLRVAFPIWPTTEVEPRRAAALRDAYRWIDANLPRDAIVQHNTQLPLEYFLGAYGNRQCVLADGEIGATITAADDLAVVRREIDGMFAADASETDVIDISRRYDIAALVVKDADGAFRARDGWAWKLPALYENKFVRVVAIKPSISP